MEIPVRSAKDIQQAAAEAVQRETGIDEAMIEALVHRFYQRVREDELIGPVFAGHVQDWPAHLERMCAFWSSVMLVSGRYHGYPMRAHLPLPIEARHFDRWLELFAEVTRELCPEKAAALFMDRAGRMALNFQRGMALAG